MDSSQEKVKSRWTRSFFTALNRRNDDERFVCDICHKDLASPSNLTLHRNTHVIERRYKCEPCQVSFHSQGHLQKHMRSTAHETRVEMTQAFGVPTSDNPRPYGCPECDVAFRKHGHLAKHLRSKSHITKMELNGLVPIGTYAALEKCGTEIRDRLVTTNCEQSLQSLRQIARSLLNQQHPTSSPSSSSSLTSSITTTSSTTIPPGPYALNEQMPTSNSAIYPMSAVPIHHQQSQLQSHQHHQQQHHLHQQHLHHHPQQQLQLQQQQVHQMPGPIHLQQQAHQQPLQPLPPQPQQAMTGVRQHVPVDDPFSVILDTSIHQYQSPPPPPPPPAQQAPQAYPLQLQTHHNQYQLPAAPLPASTLPPTQLAQPMHQMQQQYSTSMNQPETR